MATRPDINLMIAEDHHMFREGVINSLEKENGIKFIAQVENGKLLLDELEKQIPDIILMDIKMPEMDGIAATKLIVEKYPDVKVIALTMYDNDDSIITMLEAGASGYLIKNADRSDMLDAIYNVYDGKKGYDKYIHHKLVELISKCAYNPNKRPAHEELNAIEMEIIRLLCKTYSAKEIADILNMSFRTVEGYKARLLTKFNAKNTTGIVIYALKNRIIRMDEI